MNDAEFCSDAHRRSHTEEQALAMRRLTGSTPAIQRSQRMAETDSAANFSLREYLPFAPKPIPGLKLEAETVPEPPSAAVQFRNREHRYQPGLRWSLQSYRIPLKAAVSAHAPAAAPAAQSRIAIPRDLAFRPRRAGAWPPMPDSTLLEVRPPAPAAGLAQFAAKMAKAAATEPSGTVRRRIAQPPVRRERRLETSDCLSALPYTPVGSEARCIDTGGRQTAASSAIRVCYPASRLRSIAPPAPEPAGEDTEDFLAVLERSPLAALFAATHYPTVHPAPPGAPAPRTPLDWPFPSPPARFRGSLAAAATVNIPPLAGQPRAVDPPAVCFFPCANRVTPSALERAAAPCVPGRPAAEVTRALPAPDRVLPVAPPAYATAAAAAASDAAWAIPTPAGLVPAIWPLSARTCPGTAGGTALPPPEPAGSAARPRSIEPLPPAIRLCLPRHAASVTSRYPNAHCVPVAPPEAKALSCRPVIDGGDGLIPDVALPALSKQAGANELRRVPFRLFPVPGAQPMARPAAGWAMTFGLEGWGKRPAVCASGLRADDGKRRRRQISTRNFGHELRQRFEGSGLRNAWIKTTRLPSDLKWIAMVVPLILGIWVLARPTTAESVGAASRIGREAPAPVEGKETRIAAVHPVPAISTPVPVPAEPVEAEKPPMAAKTAPAPSAAIPSQGIWESFTARIADRASIDKTEDFQNGLSAWSGRGEWARTWSYDKSGTVRPGQMAIYQPSVGMRDYVFEIKASIERHSIQWLVRASGPRDYHFSRLNVTPGAPLTRLELERWTVLNGRIGRVTRLPLPHGGANQTLYAIRVEVRGDDVTTFLQDQVVDTFSDPRLPDGGVGLAGSPDDRPRIYGIRVFHQNDFFGKLCSFLVPPPIYNQGSD